MGTSELLDLNGATETQRPLHLELTPDMPSLIIKGPAAERIDARGSELLRLVRSHMRFDGTTYGWGRLTVFPVSRTTPHLEQGDPLISLERPGGHPYDVHLVVRLDAAYATGLAFQGRARHESGESALASSDSLAEAINAINRKLRSRQAEYQRSRMGRFGRPFLQLDADRVAEHLLQRAAQLPANLHPAVRR